MKFTGGSDSKASAYKVGDLCSIPGSGRCSGEGYGNPLQYSCLENPMDRGAWWSTQSTGSQRVRHDWATSRTYTYICKYTSQFNNSKYKEYQGRHSYKAKTSFSGEKNLHREYLWSSQMNLHQVGHNLQLSIKGTIILYVFTSDQWHHMYKMTNQSYIFIDVKK